MSDQIAHASIGIDINDGDALASLRRVDAAVERTMSNIERQRATAEVDANIAPFEDSVAHAKRTLKQLQGQRASVGIDGDTGAIDKAITNVKRKLRQLEGEKATVEIEYRTNDAAARAAHKQRMAELAQQAAAQKVAARQMNDAHRAALSMDKERTAAIRFQTVGIRQQEVEVRKLQQQYAKLTDKLEYLARQRPLGRENRAKVELDTASALAEMELLKAKLNVLGRTPPINIKADLDRSTAGRIGEALRGIVDKASGLSDLSVRLGPFTTSIKGAVTALGFLGPTLVDVTGSATALVGVLGTGLAGAAGVAGAAAVGAALNFGGVWKAIKPLAAQFKTVTQLSDAYDKAVLKYGESSKQAKAAQKQLNEALKQVDPNVRAATKGLSSMRKEWTGLTQQAAKRSFGDVIAESVKTGSALLPTLARNTNQTLGILDGGLTHIMQRLRGQGAQGAFLNIGRNFNEGLKPALLGLEHLGAAIGHVVESSSRLIGPAGRGFERWAAGLDKGSSNAQKLDEEVDRLGQHAKDVGKFFMALGRLIITVLNGGADAGDRLTTNMTEALNRWNDFLRSAEGKQSMADFFDRASKGADALYHALAPLATAFVSWSSNLSPFVTGVLRGIGYVSQLVAAVTKLTGLAGPLGVLGATFGAMFAIGKIGAFVSYLSRAADLLRTMGAAKGLKTLFSGGLGKAMTAESFGAGGAAAGTEIRAAMISGGAAAAAEIRAAMIGGGAAGSAGNIAGNVLGRGGARAAGAEAAEVAAGTAAGAKGAGMLRSALTALKGASLLTKASLVGLATWGGFELAKRFVAGETAADKLRDAFDRNGKAAKGANGAYRASSTGIADTAAAFQRSTIAAHEAKKALDGTKKGTDDHRLALLDYRAALRDNVKARADWMTQSRTMQSSTEIEAELDKKRVKQFDEGHSKRVQELQDLIKTSTNTRAVKAAQEDLAVIMRKRAPLEAAAVRSANQQAAAALNVGRAWRGQIPILGAAAQQLGQLARTRPNLAQTISVKFNSPKDAGAVAREAQNALKAGGSIKQVLKIVADSKDAEDAIRRLRAMNLSAKTQKILESGGDAAVSMLQRITGHKLTAKQQKIAQAGGPAVIALLGRILGVRIPPKKVAVNTNANAAAAAISAVQRAISGLTDKTVTITTVKYTKEMTAKRQGGLARGRNPGDARVSLVGEGKSGRGAAEIIADHATGGMRAVKSPTLMRLKPSEAVIPTEPGMRQRGSRLMADFAKQMGIPGFSKGKKPKNPPASSKARQNARGDARSKIKKQAQPRAYSSDNLVELKGVANKQRAENNLREQVQREASQLDGQEPATFIKVVGTDPETGDSLYAIDDAAIATWSAKLDAMAARFDQVVAAIIATQSAVQKAMTRIGNPYKENNPTTSVVGRAQHNKHTLQTLIDKEEGNKKKAKSKRSRQLADERIGVYRDAQKGEDETIKNATGDWQNLDSEMNDIGDDSRGRISEAKDAASTYRADAGAVKGKAQADAASSNPAAPKPGSGSSAADEAAPQSAVGAAQDAASGLDAQAALASIGQGAPVTDAQKIAAQQAIITAGQGQLADADKTNDSEANSAIIGAVGAIQSIQQAQQSAAANVVAQYTNYGSSMSSLSSQMGSNFQVAGMIGATSSAFAGFGGPSIPSGAGMGGAAGIPGGAGGAVLMPGAIQQTFYEMPSATTWSEDISFSLQAAMS